MSKHTPGPWLQSYEPDAKGCVIRAKGGYIGQTYGGLDDDNAANARLIAAAPEMYELLSTLVLSARNGEVDYPAYTAAEALLKRIEGES